VPVGEGFLFIQNSHSPLMLKLKSPRVTPGFEKRNVENALFGAKT
jgi:hypothetical protein